MSTLSPWPRLRRGAKEHPVPALQYLLRARGHAVTVDGLFGPRTEEAVRRFQREHVLVADGTVAAIAWSRLIIQVRQGTDGDAVRGVQEEFRYRGLCGCPEERDFVDGVFGPRTDRAVRDFQGAVQADVPAMAVDGIVGPMTWQALVSGMYSY